LSFAVVRAVIARLASLLLLFCPLRDGLRQQGIDFMSG
jgi:hypothetical protein